MKQPSASNSEAFVRCTASHVLPQHENYQPRTVTGTEDHHLVGSTINLVPGAAARLEAKLPGLHGLLAEAMDGVTDAHAEEAYVVDVQKRTSIYVGRDIGREYEKALGRPFSRYELGTSLDIHARKGDVRWVRDLKFGIYSSWWQLYLQGMAVLWLPGVKETEVDAGFLHVKDNARPDDEEDPGEDGVTMFEDAATLYLVDLDDRAEELMTAFGRAESLERQLEAGTPASDLKVVEGKWCQYCGAYPHCPAKWKLAKAMLDLDVSHHIAALTPEQCGEAWLKLAEIKKNIIKKTEDAIKVRMEKEGGFPTPDGKRLRVMPMPGRVSIDRQGVVALLRLKGATDEEIAPLFKRGEGYGQVRKVSK